MFHSRHKFNQYQERLFHGLLQIFSSGHFRYHIILLCIDLATDKFAFDLTYADTIQLN